MVLNLLRTGVGVDDIHHLHDIQSHRLVDLDGQDDKATFLTTRYMPKRKDEILKSGGSVYWIIKRQIQCRQQILGMENFDDEGGITRCCIFLNPQIVKVMPFPRKHIQGWRYLQEKDSPADRYIFDPENENLEDIPATMEIELKAAGLL